jgi:hypothetical protein
MVQKKPQIICTQFDDYGLHIMSCDLHRCSVVKNPGKGGTYLRFSANFELFVNEVVKHIPKLSFIGFL